MRFRKFIKDDLDNATSLFRDVFERDPWNDKWLSDKKAKRYLKTFVDAPNFHGYVLMDNNEVIGVSIGHIINWWQGDEYFIKEFYIDPNLQNQGLGSKFIEYIVDELQTNGVQYIVLLTDKHTNAYKFYENNGFKEVKDNAFMCKKL